MEIIRSDEVENLTSIIKEDELSDMIDDLKDNSCNKCGGQRDQMYVKIKDKESFSPLQMTVEDLKLVCLQHNNEDNINEPTDNIQEEDEITIEDEDESFGNYYREESEIDDIDPDEFEDTDEDVDDNKESKKVTNKNNILVEKSISSEKYGLITILAFISSLFTGIYIVELFDSYLELAMIIPVLVGSIIYGIAWDLNYHKKVEDKEEDNIGINIALLVLTSLTSIGFIVVYALQYITIETLLIIGITNILITYNLEKIAKYDTVELLENNVSYMARNADDRQSEMSRILSNDKDKIDVLTDYKSIVFRFISHVSSFAGLLTVYIVSGGTSFSYVYVSIFLISPLVGLIYMIYRYIWYNKFKTPEE